MSKHQYHGAKGWMFTANTSLDICNEIRAKCCMRSSISKQIKRVVKDLRCDVKIMYEYRHTINVRLIQVN